MLTGSHLYSQAVESEVLIIRSREIKFIGNSFLTGRELGGILNFEVWLYRDFSVIRVTLRGRKKLGARDGMSFMNI